MYLSQTFINVYRKPFRNISQHATVTLFRNTKFRNIQQFKHIGRMTCCFLCKIILISIFSISQSVYDITAIISYTYSFSYNIITTSLLRLLIHDSFSSGKRIFSSNLNPFPIPTISTFPFHKRNFGFRPAINCGTCRDLWTLNVFIILLLTLLLNSFDFFSPSQCANFADLFSLVFHNYEQAASNGFHFTCCIFLVNCLI